MPVENVVETDVLVIGGGMAGCFAAIKAKEQGVDVILVDKGYVSKSGQTPFAGAFRVFNPEWGHDLDAWMDQVNTMGEYVNNREWTEIVFKESYARRQDLASWGAKFGEGMGPSTPGTPQMTHLEERTHSQVMRKQAVKSGVKIMDRIMITELLKQNGKIVGAIGIPMESYDLYIFKAKATILSVGACGFKPAGWPIGELTADGEAMAYRAGAEVTGKEFVDSHSTGADNPARMRLPGGRGRPAPDPKAPRPRRRLINAEGNEIIGRGTLFLELEFEAHAGRAPVFSVSDTGEKTPMVGGAAAGMSVHKAEGIWPVNTKCATSLPGLYAAGDTLGTMQVGAVYFGPGSALAGSSVTGTRAGVAAAEYALQAEKPKVDDKELARAKKIVYAPTERKGGFSPAWVTQVLQNAMIPYFVLFVKKEDRLQASLTLVEFMRDHLVPKLFARDPHELRLAHETKNMVLNAEMKLTASLFRTESRGSHYREDYPRRDDPNWLAWVLLKEEQGQMKASKKPIPKEWWPDRSKPYEERYPFRLPGE